MFDGRVIEITSTHHQSAYPYNLSKDHYNVIGWTKGISAFHEDGNIKELPLPDNKEAEIVYYPVINALGIQGHPESMKKDHPTIQILQEMLDDFLSGELKKQIQEELENVKK